MAREAIDNARHQMGGWRDRKHRRVRAGRDTAVREEARRAAAAIAAPRRRPSALAVIGGGAIVLMVMLVAAALFLMPVRMGQAPYVYSSSPAPMGVGREPAPLYRIIEVPQQYVPAVSFSTPAWVLTAEHDMEEGRVMLQDHLEVLRDLVPMRCEHREQAPQLPSFKVVMWTYEPEQQARMLATFERFLRAAVFDSDLANDLMQWTPAVLALAANRLGEVRFDDAKGKAQARRLHALLVYATGCQDIELIDDEDMSGPQLARANRNLAVVWHWYLNEVARDDKTWQTFRRLSGHR
jgi:hypothetical protein